MMALHLLETYYLFQFIGLKFGFINEEYNKIKNWTRNTLYDVFLGHLVRDYVEQQQVEVILQNGAPQAF